MLGTSDERTVMADLDYGFVNPAPKRKKKKHKKRSFLDIFYGIFPVKTDSPAEIARKTIFLVSIIVLIIAAALIVVSFFSQEVAKSATEEKLKALASKQTDIVVNNTISDSTQSGSSDTPAAEKINESRFSQFYEINNDFVGWIKVPGTNIDYPVTQTTDNEYYLKTDFYGNPTDMGNIFADYTVPIADGKNPPNTILYGHNMRTKYQFQALMSYKRRDFLENFPTIEFDTLYSNNTYKIFAMFLVNTREEHGEVFYYHMKTTFKDQDDFNSYVAEAMDRSYYHTGVDLKYGDEIITLSTCDFSSFADLRFVVMARKIRLDDPDDSVTIAPEDITENENQKFFDAYYDAFGGKPEEPYVHDWDTSLIEGFDDN